MNPYDLKKEFEKIERLIAINSENGKNIDDLLLEKIKLLKIGYRNIGEPFKNDPSKKIAPIFAKELAFLNNIKKLQTELNETTEDTEKEIAKIHKEIRENGLGWLLDHMPEAKKD